MSTCLLLDPPFIAASFVIVDMFIGLDQVVPSSYLSVILPSSSDFYFRTLACVAGRGPAPSLPSSSFLSFQPAIDIPLSSVAIVKLRLLSSTSPLPSSCLSLYLPSSCLHLCPCPCRSESRSYLLLPHQEHQHQQNSLPSITSSRIK